MTTGFSEQAHETLRHIQITTLEQFTYETDKAQWGLNEYWEDDQWLLPAVIHNAPLKADCEAFAMVCMRKAMAAGFKARLIVCLTETKEGHAICEVSSNDNAEAYYFDNRRRGLAARQALVGYYFYSASPWNPVPKDSRPWNLIEQQAA